MIRHHESTESQEFMARKVFISVLGASAYKECKYQLEDGSFTSEPVKYVQEAVLHQILASKWTEKDCIIIFLTKGASGSRRKNWDDQEAEGGQGLHSRLKSMNLKASIQGVDIPDGKSTEEIQQVFTTMYQELAQHDEVYVDITHGFRYLPMLVLSLLNYAKTLKSVYVKQITYGNYENRDKENEIAPLYDLTYFIEIQDWTKAASDFVQYGQAADIKVLAARDNQRLFQSGEGAKSTPLVKIAGQLEILCDNINLVRFDNIYQSESAREIRKHYSSVEPSVMPIFQPIIERIIEKIAAFKDEPGIHNAYAAVEWCIKHGQYQQGYSLLIEAIISKWLILLDGSYKDLRKRNMASFLSDIIINKIHEEKWSYDSNERALIRKWMRNHTVVNEAPLIQQLKQTRNDVMHGGISLADPSRVKTLKSNLKKYYERLNDN